MFIFCEVCWGGIFALFQQLSTIFKGLLQTTTPHHNTPNSNPPKENKKSLPPIISMVELGGWVLSSLLSFVLKCSRFKFKKIWKKKRTAQNFPAQRFLSPFLLMIFESFPKDIQYSRTLINNTIRKRFQ